MKIEVGKKYIAENGYIIEIFHQLNPEWTGFPFVGYSHETDFLARYAENGDVNHIKIGYKLIKESSK